MKFTARSDLLVILQRCLKATAELPRFARVTFFVAKKVTKENSQYQGKSAVCDMAGIFRCGILPRRKTAHIVCAALRVCDHLMVRRFGTVVGTKMSAGAARGSNVRHLGESMKPAWLKLSEQSSESGYFGLTIPFILGALRAWPGRPLGDRMGVEELRVLLTSVSHDAPPGILMRLHNCGKVQDLILASVGGVPSNCIALTNPVRPVPSLYVENGVIPEENSSFEALASELWRRYKDDIEEEHFSRRGGSYYSFNEPDKALISKAIERPDEDFD